MPLFPKELHCSKPPPGLSEGPRYHPVLHFPDSSHPDLHQLLQVTSQRSHVHLPLYNGVSVVDFTCQVGDRVLYSEVKTKKKADQDYTDAVTKGQSAATFDHSESASDVFTIRLGNVPAGEQVVVDLTFVGELKQDVQEDGVRYMIPNSISPRYRSQKKDFLSSLMPCRQAQNQGISIVVDVLIEKPSVIREVQSPSHPIKVSLGRMSSHTSSVFEPHQASASLQISKENGLLERDFVIVANSDGQD